MCLSLCKFRHYATQGTCFALVLRAWVNVCGNEREQENCELQGQLLFSTVIGVTEVSSVEDRKKGVAQRHEGSATDTTWRICAQIVCFERAKRAFKSACLVRPSKAEEWGAQRGAHFSELVFWLLLGKTYSQILCYSAGRPNIETVVGSISKWT